MYLKIVYFQSLYGFSYQSAPEKKKSNIWCQMKYFIQMKIKFITQQW